MAARSEAFVERGAQHYRGRAFFDSGLNRPAALAGIRDAAGILREIRLLEKGYGSQVEKPRCDDAAAAPNLCYVRKIKIVLIVFRVAQRRGFGITFGFLFPDIRIFENI